MNSLNTSYDSTPEQRKYSFGDYIEHYKDGANFILENATGILKDRIVLFCLIYCLLDGNYYQICLPLLILNQFGWKAEKFYTRTKQHIEKFGEINPRYFTTVLGKESENKAVGYCQLQGMYLAAKEFGLEEEFFRMKKELTNNKIPNF